MERLVPAPRSRSPSSVARRPARTLLLAFLLALLPSSSAAQRVRDVPEELDAIRAALGKYEDSARAEYDFYSSIGCVSYAMEGESGQPPATGVGVYLVNGALLLDGELDPEHPEGLIYVRTKDGSLRLVGAEWILPAEDATGRPRLFGHDFEGPVDLAGTSPLQTIHMREYDLHVWLWAENPDGLFARSHPSLHCPDDGYTIEGVPP